MSPQLLNGSSAGVFDTTERLQMASLLASAYPALGNVLTDRASAAALPDPGNTPATARDLGALSRSLTVSDRVSLSDPNDYYRFRLSTTSAFNLTLTGLSADADVQLLSSSGSVLSGSNAGGSASEAIARTLSAGDYYVRVYRYAGTTNYTLNLTAIATAAAPYTADFGYGAVNAAAAVARSIAHSSSFAAVPDRGGDDWNLDRVNAPEVWAQGYTGQGVVVAVVDSGVDYTHPDLDRNIWSNVNEIPGNGIDDDRNGFIDDVRGWDFVDSDNTPLDLNGHGTHVAGTIAAENNDFGVTGVAYNARIMPVRVLGADGQGSTATVAAGIRYAASNGADVINLSLGGGYSPDINSAIQFAVQHGSLVTIAAGNSGGLQPEFPANLNNPGVVAVGAIDRSDRLASFSNRAGTSPLNFVVAPGVGIYSSTPNNTYRSYSGTSMATPHVAGVAALILSANPDLTPAQVASLLIDTANPSGLVV